MWNLLLNHNRKRRNVCRGRGSVDVYRTWDLQIEKCADSPNSCNQDMETSGESGPQYILLSFLDAYYTIKLDSNNLLLGFCMFTLISVGFRWLGRGWGWNWIYEKLRKVPAEIWDACGLNEKRERDKRCMLCVKYNCKHKYKSIDKTYDWDVRSIIFINV